MQLRCHWQALTHKQEVGFQSVLTCVPAPERLLHLRSKVRTLPQRALGAGALPLTSHRKWDTRSAPFDYHTEYKSGPGTLRLTTLFRFVPARVLFQFLRIRPSTVFSLVILISSSAPPHNHPAPPTIPPFLFWCVRKARVAMNN